MDFLAAAAASQVHRSQSEITDRAHAQMLLAD
jgi:hypothetical protein